MSATIRIFQVGDRFFSHVMNAYHDSVDLRDEYDETLLTFGADARVSNRDGRTGHFHVEYVEGQPCWVYYELPLQTRHVYGTDLHSAEVEVSRRYIADSAARLIEQDAAAGYSAAGQAIGALAFSAGSPAR